MQRGETASEETVKCSKVKLYFDLDGVRATPKLHVSQLSPHAYSSRVRGQHCIEML